ncbi:MAG: hypothetical protein Aurels2KO_39180 [Aureliella sp.]
MRSAATGPRRGGRETREAMDAKRAGYGAFVKRLLADYSVGMRIQTSTIKGIDFVSFHLRTNSVLLRVLAVLCTVSSLAPAIGGDDVPSAGMMRYPDVSKTHIVFVYAGDLWTVPREGGVASPLASPAGSETNPRFSDSGDEIAFVGNYDDGSDIYKCSIDGGIPERVTYHPGRETLCDWTPDGGLLYFSSAFTGLARMTHLLTISDEKPYPVKLPVPYGTNGAISPDGSWLAYTPYSRDTRTWKRYRGGMASDVWLFNLKTNTSKQITDWEGTDTLPMWHGQTVYYLSDAGPNSRLNLWSYDTNTGQREQVTQHADYDVKWPSIGPATDGSGEIVYQQGASLRLLSLASGESSAVEVKIPGARPRLRQMAVDASDNLGGASISPSGKRVAAEARGDIWSLPAKNGTPRNLTATSGVAERSPSWSPDGRWIAYFSDATGEYELTITQSDGRGETRRLTNDGQHWRSNPVWSPDSKWIAFTDKTGAYLLHNIDSGKTQTIYKDPTGDTATISWSGDSRWIAHTRSAETGLNISAVWVYDVSAGEATQLTSGYFNDSSPTFDRKGDFLYYQSNRRFDSPSYEDIGESFVYRDTGVLLALPLRSDVKNPLLKSIDTVEWDEEEPDDSDAEDGDEKTEESSDTDGEAEEKANSTGDDNSGGDSGDDTSGEIAGTWSLTVNSSLVPEEARSVTMVINRADDGSLSGQLLTPGGSIPLGLPSYDAGSKTFTANVETPLGDAVLTGKVDGNQMTGAAKVTTIGAELPFTAERASDSDGASDDDSAAEPKKGKSKEKSKAVEIEFDGAEQRVIPLPVSPGRFRGLQVNSRNQLIYSRASDGIMVFDLSDSSGSEKVVVSGGGGYELSADGKKLLLMRGAISITEPSAGKGPGKTVSTSGMIAHVDPRAEWKQMVVEAWRYQRDFFYDPNMHGVDWPAVREQYLKLLPDAASRDDVGFIIAEMISELNVGHAYYRGVPLDEDVPSSRTAVLGCELEAVDGKFRIAEFWEGGVWDTDAQSPLRTAGVKAGQYLLEVEGSELSTNSNPYQALAGLAGKLVEVVVSDDTKLDDGDTRIAVTLPRSDGDLRFRHWIERNRAYVDEKTDGKVGYIFVTNTGRPGQNDLFRQFYAQSGKAALIIDERWNGGGQIPTRFIELLNRPVTNYWARRDSVDWVWPPDSHQGPKCMLINGMSGSGGDMFPALFKQNKLGKLIGRRTWGGLVGIQGNLELIDGGSVTVPSFAYYQNDGTWGIEGHGVDPDIEVIDDPARMVDGGDPQLDAAIKHMLEQIETSGYKPPARPAYPRREKMGIPKSDY